MNAWWRGQTRHQAQENAGTVAVTPAGQESIQPDAGVQDQSSLVVVNIPGVQRFIAASRTTADLWGGSEIIARLMRRALEASHSWDDGDAEVILPWQPNEDNTSSFADGAASDESVPNRIVVSIRKGDPAILADNMTAAMRHEWQQCLRGSTTSESESSTQGVLPGALQSLPVRWAVIDGEHDYPTAWKMLNGLLAARKRARTFQGYEHTTHTIAQPAVCRQCGMLPPRAEVRVAGCQSESLCAVCAAKRRFRSAHLGEAFPSTADVATAPYRATLLDALLDGDADQMSTIRQEAERLVGAWQTVRRRLDAYDGYVRATPTHNVLPGLPRPGNDNLARTVYAMDGTWLLRSRWDAGAILRDHLGSRHGIDPETIDAPEADTRQSPTETGRVATHRLTEMLQKAELVPGPPATYLALLSQDADNMGRQMSDSPAISKHWHQQVSRSLIRLAGTQRRLVEDRAILGRVVYAGGDDLLALVPARTAHRAARQLRERYVHELDEHLRRPRVSTALVFFHYAYPLQDAVARAREALDEAKDSGRNRLSVVVLRRGGERARSVLLWQSGGDNAAGILDELVDDFRGDLSARLIFDLEHARAALTGSGFEDEETERLVTRHGGSTASVQRVRGLRRMTASFEHWIGALLAAHFLAQEGR